MDGIVGVWTESSDGDARTVADFMLTQLRHRGPVRIVDSLSSKASCDIAVGCVSSDPNNLLSRSHTTFSALYGSFYRFDNLRNAGKWVVRQVDHRPANAALKGILRRAGGFAALVARGTTLYAFRDVNGMKPLYFARSRRFAAIATERKALWRIGLKDSTAVTPGSIVQFNRKGLKETHVVRFRRPKENIITFNRAATVLQHLLSASIRRITAHVGDTCVAFSGGLDSAVTGAMTKRCGVNLRAVSVGLKNSPEMDLVDKFATQLGLDITVETFDPDSIEEYIRRVLWLIEEPNLMKLSVAIPLHWAAMVASRRGCKVMLCGQGSDELYGGYAKYAHILKTKGRRALSAQLFRSVIESSQVNYERDEQATSPFPIELRTPFADPAVIRFSLTLPSEFKVRDGEDVTRKWILREVARRIGVPEQMAMRRKKAIQHGTGVEKAIIKLARRQGLQPQEYLVRTFDEVKGMDSMP